MKTIEKLVEDFHISFKQPVNTIPHLPLLKERELREKLLIEEFKEYTQGERNNDLVNIAEELADMIYIIYGTAHSYGIPLDKVIRGIHKANMNKLWEDGNPRYYNIEGKISGKLMKPPGWIKSDTKKILEQHGYREN